MDRLTYFIRRLLLVFPTFIGITFICFSLCQFVPGGPMEQMVMKMKGMGIGEAGAANVSSTVSEEYLEELKVHFGFDKPLYQRYGKWLITDRIGMSMESYKFPNKTAWQLIKERFPISLIFGITSFVLTYLICIPLGIVKAVRNGGLFDFSSSLIVFSGYAIPAFAFGMMLKMLLCGTSDQFWDIFPIAGFYSDNFHTLSFFGKVKDIFSHMFLPVLCYMIGQFAVLTLLMKNSLLDEIGKDYIRTVIAKGGSFSLAVWGHALRNAMIPIATGFGSVLSIMFVGSVIIERVFEIPGMGLLSLDAMVGRDYAVFMGILSLTSILTLAGNILSDFCYVLIDPRINFK